MDWERSAVFADWPAYRQSSSTVEEELFLSGAAVAPEKVGHKFVMYI
jgi:hypothetical protein